MARPNARERARRAREREQRREELRAQIDRLGAEIGIAPEAIAAALRDDRRAALAALVATEPTIGEGARDIARTRAAEARRGAVYVLRRASAPAEIQIRHAAPPAPKSGPVTLIEMRTAAPETETERRDA
jgi:hypothetical protein